ncbi:zinc metallopeptidase [Macrococcus equipercicus]|uniref:Zinc metallopeptidase n=1 Tax=Macrococcus equipercicus TaxID=69967 RepID=A0A9Q9BP56_9STAP|nr:zinc metallopeptidase [Macrococcus equipercicus]KAA1040196.1 zinc metallopeptidase [Macrococcus equipercicus]UTH12859.1 zinc metallopeptidase [Macrococcus equipercicus]
MGYIIYFVLIMLIPMYFQARVKSTYNKYSKVRSTSGKSGRQVAEEILAANGIHDVQVIEGQGFLSDHYDPRSKRVVLSPSNFRQPSVAGTAIAAHEVGHAIQHATGYGFLKFRTSLLPLANLGTSFSYLLIMIGAVLTSISSTGGGIGSLAIWAGVALMAFAVLFSIVTLPVEFDASKRAMQQIQALHMVDAQEYRHAKSVLSAAAMTYVAATAIAVAEFVRMFMLARSSD